MPIFLPERSASSIDSLTPRQIVAELDKYVIGQAKAKRAVAIALRNRIRRQKLPRDIRGLLGIDDVKDVLDEPRWGGLTGDLVRQCSGS